MTKDKPSNGASSNPRSRAPRAVKLDRGAYGDDIAQPTPETGATLSMTPDHNPDSEDYFDRFDTLDEPSFKPVRKKSWSLSTFFWSAISGVVMLALGLWLDGLVRELFARWDYLGWAGLALVGVATLSLFLFLLREFLAMRRLSHLGDLRDKVTDLHENGDRKSGMKAANDLLGLYAKQPSLFKARQALKQDLPHLFDAEDILAQTEKHLMPPLDQAATHRVHQAARRVALVTALSPRPIFDILVVLIETVRMIRAIAEIYGNRPGLIAMLRLSGHIAGHLAVTGGMAAGETLIQQIVGHGLAARLSAKLGEGLLNGILTARIGLATIDLCRPMPFVSEDQPKLGAVIKTLRAQSEELESEPSKDKKAKA